MAREPLKGLLGVGGGTVEADETWIGGKPRKSAGKRARLGTYERKPMPTKTRVVGLVERGGRARAHVVPNLTGPTLKAAVRAQVDKSARLMTDENPAYFGLGAEFAGHETVNHGAGEYARGDATTNTVEGFFGLFKRGVVGSFHHISEKHMNRYLSEFSFRWDLRKVSDGERTAEAIRAAEGKRLMYRVPVKDDGK